MKNITDILIGFPIIGFFTGFWSKLENLHVDWDLVVGTILIQVVVIVFKSAFVGWWQKYGKKWLGLSVLLLVGCSSPQTIQSVKSEDPVAVPPVNISMEGGTQRQIELDWHITIDSAKNKVGGFDKTVTKRSDVIAGFDSLVIVTDPKTGEKVADLKVSILFDSRKEHPFKTNFYLFNHLLPEGTPFVAKVEPVVRDPSFHPPSYLYGICTGIIALVTLYFLTRRK